MVVTFYRYQDQGNEELDTFDMDAAEVTALVSSDTLAYPRFSENVCKIKTKVFSMRGNENRLLVALEPFTVPK